MKLDDRSIQTPHEEYRQPEPKRLSSRPAAHRSRWWIWLLILCVLGAAGYMLFLRIRDAQMKAANSARQAPRSFPVVAAVAHRGDMPVYLNGLGTVQPFNVVTVRSRVDGQLMHVYFKEGDLVKQDQPLAQIDPRPFQAALEQAQGQLQRDQALLANAKVDLARYQSIKTSIPEQQITAQQSLIAQYEGTVKTDQGQVSNAQVNLEYCNIASPLSGRIGLRLVDQGNIVHASDSNGIAVITQLQPIAVYFYLREDDIPEVLKRLNGGQTLGVDALDHDLKNTLASGSLLATDNQVDPTTGTLQFKAVFPNENNVLFPKQFVNARLLLDTLSGVVIVPSPAVQHGPSGETFVYVVKPSAATRPAAAATPPATQPDRQEQSVELRNVAVGHEEGDQIAIASGVAPGEIVVTDGVDKLQDGTKVTARVQRPAAATTQSARGATTRLAGRTGGRSGRRGGE
jgi:multidrug efflux system membrane fusion protein